MAELNVLLGTAVTLAFIHTVIGVDHYVPFIALSKANNWTLKKTMLIVLVCGLGHVLGSVILGIVGLSLTAAVSTLVDIQDIRGDIATYFLIAFGLVYTAYGIRNAVKNKTHTHITAGGQTVIHAHSTNGNEHCEHRHNSKKSANVFWGLFILFILGPCEPLIPVFMYPAASANVSAIIAVTTVYAGCTISAMLLMTFLGVKGVEFVKVDKLKRYAHAMAGSAVLTCGVLLLLLPI